MIRGRTNSGFEFAIEKETLDDYELLETLCKIDEGDHSRIPKMVNILLGEEQREGLKEHIRGEDGNVSAKKLLTEVVEIFQSCKEGKNC